MAQEGKRLGSDYRLEPVLDPAWAVEGGWPGFASRQGSVDVGEAGLSVHALQTDTTVGSSPQAAGPQVDFYYQAAVGAHGSSGSFGLYFRRKETAIPVLALSPSGSLTVAVLREGGTEVVLGPTPIGGVVDPGRALVGVLVVGERITIFVDHAPVGEVRVPGIPGKGTVGVWAHAGESPLSASFAELGLTAMAPFSGEPGGSGPSGENTDPVLGSCVLVDHFWEPGDYPAVDAEAAAFADAPSLGGIGRTFDTRAAAPGTVWRVSIEGWPTVKTRIGEDGRAMAYVPLFSYGRYEWSSELVMAGERREGPAGTLVVDEDEQLSCGTADLPSGIVATEEGDDPPPTTRTTSPATTAQPVPSASTPSAALPTASPSRGTGNAWAVAGVALVLLLAILFLASLLLAQAATDGEPGFWNAAKRGWERFKEVGKHVVDVVYEAFGLPPPFTTNEIMDTLVEEARAIQGKLDHIEDYKADRPPGTPLWW